MATSYTTDSGTSWVDNFSFETFEEEQRRNHDEKFKPLSIATMDTYVKMSAEYLKSIDQDLWAKIKPQMIEEFQYIDKMVKFFVDMENVYFGTTTNLTPSLVWFKKDDSKIAIQSNKMSDKYLPRIYDELIGKILSNETLLISEITPQVQQSFVNPAIIGIDVRYSINWATIPK